MAIDDKISPDKKMGPSESKGPPPERYMILKRNGEQTVMEKRRYLLEKAMKKKSTEYAVQPPYVPAQNL
ncbi:MAG: hypothetical protein QW666_02870 [Candidatus Woesearchaeota archaeon]